MKLCLDSLIFMVAIFSWTDLQGTVSYILRVCKSVSYEDGFLLVDLSWLGAHRVDIQWDNFENTIKGLNMKRENMINVLKQWRYSNEDIEGKQLIIRS
jgi:hypothetical protein